MDIKLKVTCAQLIYMWNVSSKRNLPPFPKKVKEKEKKQKGKKSSQYKTKATPGWILKYANQLFKGSWLFKPLTPGGDKKVTHN